MTALSLLLWITLAIILQLLIYLGISLWSKWNDYQSIHNAETSSRRATLEEISVGRKNLDSPAWLGLRSFRVSRKVFEDVNQTICSFYLVPVDGLPLPPFLPGQFLTFSLDFPKKTGGTESLIRCYSLSDKPNQDCYRVSIKRVAPPIGVDVPMGRSSNYFHDHISVGSLLQIRAPSGHFHIDESDAPIVLIGGGIGITPMLSILNWCIAKESKREIWLFYGVRNSEELIMASHLEALTSKLDNLHILICYSDPLSGDITNSNYHHGRVDIKLLRATLSFKPYHFYICGPAPMMESLVPALDDWGVPDTHIHFEAFGPASIKRHNATTSAPAVLAEVPDTDIMVNFAVSGKQLPWSPTANLLEYAEANGIVVSSGCRAGSCGTCQTTIRSGEVTYAKTPDFNPDSGTCLLCVCSPKTSLTLEI
jgi:ferredoxin-NADP reductase